MGRNIVAAFAVAIAAGENGRKLEVELFHAHGHEAQHVFVDAELALHFLDDAGRGVDRQEGVVTLAVFLDAIGEVAKAPVLDLGDVAAAFLDEDFQLIVEGFSLLRRDVLPRDHDVLVERHGFLLPLWKAARPVAEVRRSRWILTANDFARTAFREEARF